MIPSSSATLRRRNRNASAPVPVRASAASARALAAGLWRLRHAQRMKKASQARQPSRPQKLPGRTRESHLCHGKHCHPHHHRGILLDKIEALQGVSSMMEKATKWDAATHPSPRPLGGPLMLLIMEAELEKARGHIGELEEERRVLTRRLERFLRKLADDKARARDRARYAVAALRDERAHRRQLEQANAKLLRDLAEARSAAEQQAQSYDVERRARELMEEACSELTREVEEDQAEVELLRRECLRMREEMEEERRMLQMAEVWREERVQMKLSDAKLALETKYSQLNRLQAEMEAFLRTKDALRTAAAAAAAPSSSRRCLDADSVLEHFRRKEQSNRPASSNSNSNSSFTSNSNTLQSPATDLFLAKVDDDDAHGGSSADMDYDGGRDSCSWFGTTSDRSASVAYGNDCGRSAGKKNTALIRKLWRSAITESRNKTATGGSQATPPPGGRGTQQSKQSLREKLMEARMDDHKPVHAVKHRT